MKYLLFLGVVSALWWFGDLETRGIVILYGIIIGYLIIKENYKG